MILDDGTPRALNPSKLVGVKYWAFYYSASWCPPCRAFTPDLVSFYNDFKPSHPDFELIFVNDDRSEDDMLNYMKGDSMPWPAVWYSDIENPSWNRENIAARASRVSCWSMPTDRSFPTRSNPANTPIRTM